MNLDLYHAQIGEGNLIELVRGQHPLVGEVQVADVPGRCEPGTGEIRYPAVAAALAETGYDGVVAMEAWAVRRRRRALEASAPRSRFPRPAEPRAVATRPGPGRTPP